jgi:hypothetical protein
MRIVYTFVIIKKKELVTQNYFSNHLINATPELISATEKIIFFS